MALKSILNASCSVRTAKLTEVNLFNNVLYFRLSAINKDLKLNKLKWVCLLLTLECKSYIKVMYKFVAYVHLVKSKVYICHARLECTSTYPEHTIQFSMLNLLINTTRDIQRPVRRISTCPSISSKTRKRERTKRENLGLFLAFQFHVFLQNFRD